MAQCFAVPREAPQLEFESFDEPHQAAYAKTVAEVLVDARRLPQTLSRAARALSRRGNSSERRSAASSSHSRPCDADVSAMRDRAETGRSEPIGLRIGAHRVVDVAAFLQHHAEIERCFRMVGLYLDRHAVGRRRSGMVAQILPREAEIEPDRGGGIAGRGALQQADSFGVIAVLPRQPAKPGGGLLMLRNDL